MADKKTPEEILDALVKAAPKLAGAYAELKTFQIGVAKATAGIKENAIASVGAIMEVQKASVEASKVLGSDFNKEVERSIALFEKLSGEKGLGIALENTKKAAFSVGQTFKNTAFETDSALNTMSTAAAKYSNVLDQSKMIDYMKKMAFESNMGAEGASSFAEKMIHLSDSIGRPPEQLLKLSAELLNTNVAFGSTDDAIGRLALRTDRFAHSLGISADKVKGLLGGMMTIGDRQQVSARLSQIGMMVSQQTGHAVDVDIQGLLSSDPNRQLGAFKTTLKSLSKASQNLTTGQKQSLALSLVRSTKLGGAIGYEGVHAALSDPSRIDEMTDAAKARRDQIGLKGEGAGAFAGFFNKAGTMDDKRVRQFAETLAKANEFYTAKRFEVARQEITDISGALATTQSLLDITLEADEKGIEALKTISAFVGETTTALLEIVSAFVKVMSSAASTPADRAKAIADLTAAVGKLKISSSAQAAAIKAIRGKSSRS